jgi:beta-glucanase (GH16 family)
MPEAHSSRGRSLTWAEEFDAGIGQQPSAQRWNSDLGDGCAHGIPGWGNNEREYYRAENGAHDGESNLLISARRMPTDNPYQCYYGTPAEWTSGKFTTFGKVHFRYGHIEARIKFPTGVGTWPAFWMLGTDLMDAGWPQCGEIDIAEGKGAEPSWLFGTLHGPGYCGDEGRGLVFDSGLALGDEFHTFAIDWLPGSIAWSLDGREYSRLTSADIAPNEWVFDHDFYIVVNLAMGGNFTGPIDDDLQSASMVLDFIRHYSIDGVGSVIIP